MGKGDTGTVVLLLLFVRHAHLPLFFAFPFFFLALFALLRLAQCVFM